MMLVTGLIGVALVLAFLGVLTWWIREVPLTLIVVAVMLMLIYDFVQTLRHGENAGRR
jgi:hypothetical protein